MNFCHLSLTLTPNTFFRGQHLGKPFTRLQNMYNNAWTQPFSSTTDYWDGTTPTTSCPTFGFSCCGSYLGFSISFSVLRRAFQLTDWFISKVDLLLINRATMSQSWSEESQTARLLRVPRYIRCLRKWKILFAQLSRHFSCCADVKISKLERKRWNTCWSLFVWKCHYFSLLIIVVACGAEQHRPGFVTAQGVYYIHHSAEWKQYSYYLASCLSQTRGRRFIITRRLAARRSQVHAHGLIISIRHFPPLI